MYLAKLKVSEFRGFHGTRKVDLDFSRPDGSYAGWTVIAGRNGSGKTSLLRAMALTLFGNSVAQNLAPEYPTWRSSKNTEGVIAAEFFLDSEDLAALTPGTKPPKPGIHAGLEIILPVREEIRTKGVRSFVSSTWKEWAIVDPSAKNEKEEGVKKETDQPRTLNWFAAGYGPFRRLSRDFTSGHQTSEALEIAGSSNLVGVRLSSAPAGSRTA